MPSPPPGKEEPIALIQAGDARALEQLCWKGHWCFGRWQAEHELAMCPGRQKGQQHPRLYQQQQG